MINELFDDEEVFVNYFKKNDSLELRKNIIKTDKLRFWYCRWVRDREELWSAISSDKWKYAYCLNVRDCEKVWLTITEDKWISRYCRYVKDRPILKARFTIFRTLPYREGR